MMTKDPQLLLTDQRSKAKKLVDRYDETYAAPTTDYVKHYRDAFPGMLKAFTDSVPFGGTVTGRWTGCRLPPVAQMPAVLDRGEAIIPFAQVDYGKVEARVLSQYVTPKRAAANRMAKQIREHSRAVSKLNDRLFLLALFGDIHLDEPEPGFKEEQRLVKLLKSPDRRQRKRGDRLLKHWYAAHKIINFKRMYRK